MRMSAPADDARRALASSRTPHAAALLFGLCAILFVAILSPPDSSAAVVRPLVRQITEGSGGSFTRLGGVAVDGEDNLWVGDGRSSLEGSNSLSEFAPALAGNSPLSSLPINAETEPASLSIRQDNGDILLTGNKSEPANPRVEVFSDEGALLSQWGKFGESAHVAVDNSSDPTDPSACKLSVCTAYVAHVATSPEPPRGDEEAPGVEKFEVDSAGEPHPAPFAATATYIQGNQIVGTPVGPDACEEERAVFGAAARGTPESVATDSQGNIYVVDSECRTRPETTAAVLEYRPSGEFVRAITGAETPGLKGHGHGGWGGVEGVPIQLTGLAFDSSNDHLLVSVAAGGETGAQGAIDEFDAATGSFVGQVTETTEGNLLADPVSVTVDSNGNLYVADRATSSIDVYGPVQLRPSLRLAEPSERTATTAVLNGSVEPEGLNLATCRFQYVTEATFNRNVEEHENRQGQGFANLESGGEAPCAPAAAAIEPNHVYQPVHAEITGLISGTIYRYRLVANTEEPPGGPEVTHSLAFTAPHAPRIEQAFADNLSSIFGDLHAQINPLGAATSYHFEYDTAPYSGSASHGVSVPIPDASIGSGGPTGSVPVPVTEHLSGLAPETTYHFRVVAENAAGRTAGAVGERAEETFTTPPASIAGHPDNRAYELLTPPNKGSAEDMFANDNAIGVEPGTKDKGYPSESGDGFMLRTAAAFGPFPGSGTSVYAIARTGGAWADRSLASPSFGLQAIGGGQSTFPAFAPFDQSRVAFVDLVGAAAGVNGRRAVGLLGPPGGEGTQGEYTKLYEGHPQLGSLVDTEQTAIVGSRDLGRLILDSASHAICPGAGGQDEGSHVLCEYLDGAFNLVNVDNSGQPISRCGAALGRDTHIEFEGSAHNALSADGSHVFFTAPDPDLPFREAEPNATQGCWDAATETNTPQLYERSGSQTTQISAPESGAPDPAGLHPAAYLGAAEDGSKVFFVSRAELTKDDEGIHDPELYEWQTEGSGGCGSSSSNYVLASKGCLTRISRGESGQASGDLRAVRAISSDGSAVYFTSSAQLTADAPAPGEEFGTSELDVYRYDTNTGVTTYVSTVVEAEEPDHNSQGWLERVVGLGQARNFAPEPAVGWETTSDGDYLLFPTTRELTGYHNAGCKFALPDTQGTNDGHCVELYRYHFAPGSGGDITCVSCSPSGSAPVGDAQDARSVPNGSSADGPVRAITDDGSFVFFDTRDALVPQDIDGTLDVYEWEAQGVGGCGAVKGCVHLISSGTDSQPSFFLGASRDGGNVFFGTHARLVPADTDTAGDLYDARICTSAEPCIKSAAGETAQCQGDACQTVPPAPVNASPGSLTFSGAGNISPAAPAAAKPKTAAQLRAEKLANALKRCKRDKKKHIRAKCEKDARSKYGPPSKAKKTKRASSHRRTKR